MNFDSAGWLDQASITKSPNLYTKNNSKEIIIMHYTAGYSASSAINTFKKKSASASAHFIIDVDGSITQMVPTSQCAWHSGHGRYHGRSRVNDYSIGIEIVNPGYHFEQGDGSYVNWQHKPVSNSKLAPFPGMIEARDRWVGSREPSWPNFPEDQLDSLETLVKALLKTYPSLQDIVGHRDVDTVRKIKVDPGPAFPMRRFRMLLDNRHDDDSQPVPFKVSISSGGLNVRGGPGTDFERMDWGPLYDGEFVERIDTEGNWYLVRRWIEGNMKEGWVYSRYLVPCE